MENVCHVFAEYDPLQPCNKIIEVIEAAIARTQTQGLKHPDSVMTPPTMSAFVRQPV